MESGNLILGINNDEIILSGNNLGIIIPQNKHDQ